MPSLQQTQLPDIATLPPVMSVRLRHVLAIVEEIEAHCITVQTVDALDLDGTTTIHIDAGADLDGDVSVAAPGARPPYEDRWMKYGGVRIEWSFPLPQSTCCIGCGCTDARACYDPVLDAACAWMRKDPVAGVGVCTRCEAYTRLWDDGLRTPVPVSTTLRPAAVAALAGEVAHG